MGYSIFDETMVDIPWPEIEKAAEENAVVLLPTGVIEEHGPHMSLAVDIYCSCLTCKLVRQKLKAIGINALISPPYYWGINNATGAFPGSFTVRKSTMKALLHDLLTSLKNWGFSRVFNINWHGDYDHNIAILEAVKEARKDLDLDARCVVRGFDARRLGLSGKEPHVIMQPALRFESPPPKYLEIHAESVETGIMHRYYPNSVDIETAKKLQSTDLGLEDLMVWRHGGSDARNMTPQGYFGDPASFEKANAEEIVENLAKEIAGLIAAAIT
jgi:creatinine amidohydrolase